MNTLRGKFAKISNTNSTSENRSAGLSKQVTPTLTTEPTTKVLIRIFRVAPVCFHTLKGFQKVKVRKT